MDTLYFDCFSGISGDMTLGALLDLGVDEAAFLQELEKLRLHGYRLDIEKTTRHGIAGTRADVVLTERGDNRHGHGHHHGERNLRDIEELLGRSALQEPVKALAVKIFRELAQAEARVHHREVHEVHFHEVGAVDSLVDIVGTAICLHLLGARRVCSSPLHDGRGFIECRHGRLPVPVPAVMELLKDSGIPLIQEDVETELVTPTGAAIIKVVATSFGAMPPLRVDGVGYGMGSRDTGRLNALRVVRGAAVEESAGGDEVVVLETNIDDSTPEVLGYAMERLLESGALDVFYTPVYMKKNRPAFLLTVLAREKDEERLSTLILEETSAIGLRRSLRTRRCLDREIVEIQTELGAVRVKVASRGNFRKAAPEYEDVREIARRTGLPMARVYEAAAAGVRKLLDGAV